MKKFFLILVLIPLIFGGIVTAFPLFDYTAIAGNIVLDTKEDIMNRKNTGIILLDRNGTPFYKFYEAKHSTPVALSDIPEQLQKAVIAAEDKDFYSHPGYSIRSMAAAAVANVRRGEAAYGGSTITQQLVKNALLTSDRDLKRKYQEILLAKELEHRYSKDEILEMYLNSVYFGEGAFGVEEAANVYFDMPLKDLTLEQSALLAGLLVAPSRLSPISGDKAAAFERQRVVLQRMVEEGYITEAERNAADQAKVAFASKEDSTFPYQAPHFAQMVKEELIQRYGEEEVARSGYIVQTTLDLSWQNKAETAVKDQVEKLKNNQATNAAAVVLDPSNGAIRALVGSVDWDQPDFGKFNVATATRQSGSSFKPVVYLAGLESGQITPATILDDKPTTFGKNYKPENYDGHYRGKVTVRRSLANSLNIPTVEVQQKIGVPATLNLAKRLGITSLDDFSDNDLSLSLGSGGIRLLELTNAYATLADAGQFKKTTTIEKINDKKGELIYTLEPEKQQAVEARYTYLMSSILSDNSARKEVFGDALTLSRPAAAKTGTSQDYRDSWTIGYTPQLAVGVWVGNNNNKPMDNVAGSLGAAPIWKNLMEIYLSGMPVQEFVKPEGVVEVNLCKGSGRRADFTSSDTYKEVFIEGTEPQELCSKPEPSPSPSPEPSPEATPLPDALPLEGVGGSDTVEPLPTPTPTPNPQIIDAAQTQTST